MLDIASTKNISLYKPGHQLGVCIFTADFWGSPTAGGTATAYHLLAHVRHFSFTIIIFPERRADARGWGKSSKFKKDLHCKRACHKVFTISNDEIMVLMADFWKIPRQYKSCTSCIVDFSLHEPSCKEAVLYAFQSYTFNPVRRSPCS